MIKHFSLGFLLSLLYLPIISAQASLETLPPESVGMSSERLLRLNEVMHEYVDQGQLAGVQTAIIRKGKLVHLDTYGHADLEEKKPLQDNSIWRIYSMTKPIVSVALMMLYEEGQFQLNDPVHLYIPSLKELQVHQGNGVTAPAKNHIRIVDVMRHTTGFGYGWGANSYVDSLYRAVNIWALPGTKAFVEHLGTLPLYHEPGSGFRYGVSTDVAGHLVEVLSGQALDQFLTERILQPLGMSDTHFEVPDSKDERFVTSYTTNKEGQLKATDHPSRSRYTQKVKLFSGGGGLVSTTHDYLRFCRMLLNGGALEGVRLLSPKTIELMTQDHLGDIPYGGSGIRLPSKGVGFGLGFSVVKDLAATAATGSVGAFGWGGAAGTYFTVDPKEDLIYLMMIQLRPYSHLKARERFRTMVYQAIVE